MRNFIPPIRKKLLLLIALLMFLGVSASQAAEQDLITEQVSINVKRHGTLSSLISNNSKLRITNLKISGELDIDDIAFIRAMAGSYYDDNYHRYDGHLQHLDLSNTQLIPTGKRLRLYFFGSNEEAKEGRQYYARIEDGERPQALFSCLYHTLRSVALPKTLTEVGDSMFHFCKQLEHVTIPAGVKRIGHGAFTGDSLQSISLPGNLESIGEEAFMNCQRLHAIYLPYNLKQIGNFAFSGCYNISSITLPFRLESMGRNTFYNCKNLAFVEWSNSLSTIPEGTFKECKSLTSFVIPASVTNVEAYNFDNCSAISSIYCCATTPPKASHYSFEGLLSSNTSVKLYVPKGTQGNYQSTTGWEDFEHIEEFDPNDTKSLGQLTTVNVERPGNLPMQVNSWDKYRVDSLKVVGKINLSDVQFIREMACCYADTAGTYYEGHLTHLDLSEAQLEHSDLTIPVFSSDTMNIARIDADGNPIGLFDFLYKIRSVELPSNISAIGFSTFSNCQSLEHVTIPNGVKRIDTGAFLGCRSLTKVELPGKLEDINPWAFAHCYNLQSLQVPANVKCLGRYAFCNCISLTAASLPQHLESINEGAFWNCQNLSTITLPQDLDSIEDYTFLGCTGLTSLSFPQNTKSIGQEAFAGCSNLSSVKFDDNCSITSIGSGAFQNCTSLTNIAFPYNVKSISASTFEGCTALQNIDTWQVTDIGSSAFKGCTNLKALYLNNVNRIDNSAFEGCSNLNDVTFHTDVSSFTLKSSAFKGCTRLTSITLPSATTSVNDETFSGCTSLKSITLPPTLTNIGYSAFKNCNSLHFIKLPYALTSIGLEAFSGCTALDSIYAYMEKPITLSNGTFSGVDKNQCVLYVPTTKKWTYWLANVWGDFSLIKEFDALIKEQLTFKVTTAGTLSNQVNNWLMTHATDVKVTGNVNVNDIATLRQMAGCYQNNGTLTDGHMRFLNMSEATLLCNVGAINVYTSNGDSKMAMLSSGNTYSYLFAYLPNIEEIRLPQGMTATGSSFFYGDTNLKKAWLPSGITSIGTSTFNDCRSLTSVNIPSTVTEFKNFAFFACESLPTITLPSSLTTIGRSAFYACRSLQSITIPSGVTKIEDDTFFCCALSFIELPEGITSIGGTAFSSCI